MSAHKNDRRFGLGDRVKVKPAPAMYPGRTGTVVLVIEPERSRLAYRVRLDLDPLLHHPDPLFYDDELETAPPPTPTPAARPLLEDHQTDG